MKKLNTVFAKIITPAILVVGVSSCTNYNQLDIYQYQSEIHIHYSFDFWHGYCEQTLAFTPKEDKLYTLKIMIKKAKYQDNPFIKQHDCEFKLFEDD